MAAETRQCLIDLFLTDPSAEMARLKASEETLVTESFAWLLDHTDFISWHEHLGVKFSGYVVVPGKEKL